MKVYIASGWFSPEAAEELTRIEEIFDDLGFNAVSPRKIFVCPPTATQEVQEATFRGNVDHIETSDFVFVNTRAKDTGTIFEAGVAWRAGKPIVYFCQGLKGNFNMMLSRSGKKVTTSLEELREYLGRVKDRGEVIDEPYTGRIE